MNYDKKPMMMMKFVYLLFLILIFPTAKAQEALSLESAVNMALKNNFDILVADKSAAISKVNNTPGNAGMLPSVAVIGSGNYSLNNRIQKNVDG